MNKHNLKSGRIFATSAIVVAMVLSTFPIGTIAEVQEETPTQEETTSLSTSDDSTTSEPLPEQPESEPSNETSTSTPETEGDSSTSPEVSPPCCETNHQPILSFPETGPYAGDGIDPNTGDTSTQFTFLVIYTDTDNHPPSFINTFLFGHATTTVSMSVDTTAEFALHDGNYANGEQYTATAKREVVGTHYYTFIASDGNTTVQFPVFPDVAGFPLEITALPPVISPLSAEQLIFSSNRDGNWELYSMATDGAGQVNLTNNAAFDIDPGTNSDGDGDKIIFSSNRGTALNHLYIMDRDGSNVTPVFTGFVGPVNYREPNFSPDETKIIATRSGFLPSGIFAPTEVVIMNADGTNIVNLSNNPANDARPVFTPDGSRVVFASDRNSGNEIYDIYIMSIDGTQQTRLTFSTADDDLPDISPDGNRIVFATNRDGNYEIYTMNIDGSGLTRIMDNAADEVYPKFSPDGSKIAFVSNRDGNFEVYLMNADGTDQVRLTHTPADEFQPAFLCATPSTQLNNLPTLSFLETSPDGLSENDGIQDNKGTAGKTLFSFDVIYTDKDNDAPSSVRLVVEKVNQGGFEDYFSSEMLPFSPQTDYANGKIYTLDGLFPKGDYRYRFEASDGVSNVQTPFTEFTVGYSNVAFLPGLEASRLYEPGAFFENQLWEPNRNNDVEQLYLSSTTGASLNSSIYTRDIIDEANSIPDPIGILDTNIYKSFISLMNTMKLDGVINDWEALPYDWRLDLDNILASGRKTGDKISYLEATSTPFILQELRHLAETSDTGKVTIITHSNGGLLAKYLLKKLENENDPLLRKVDKIIMVAAPQTGTPAAVEGLLHGDESQLGAGDFGFLLDEERARELAENMQSAYNLLPSQKYFETVFSPVFEFDDSVSRIPELANRSGTQVVTFESMRRFLEGDGTRTEPDSNDEEYPNVLKSHFLSRAINNHDTILDVSQPGTKIVQIGGWGIKTIRGIKYSCGLFTCLSLSTLDREVLRTHEGDGTVVIPSAVAMTTSSNVERYYVNIREYNSSLKKNRDHSSIFEVDSLRAFIKNLIQENGALTDHISTTIPPVGDLTALDYTIHSPVEIHLYDAEGNHTGLIPNPFSDSDLRAYEARIPNSYYREYGEVKYAGSDTFATTTVVLLGETLGTFTFGIEETLGDKIINSLSFIDIPVAASTKATLAIQNIKTASALQLDIEGDGVVDFSLASSQKANPVMSLNIFERVVRTLGFEKGVVQSIIAKIAAAKDSLERGNKEAARGQLNALANYLRAQTGKKIDVATAETLIKIIGRIQAGIVQ